MKLERSPTTASAIEVLDNVLDKGIVIDAWVRVALAGIDVLTVEARVVVSSIATYLAYAPAFSMLGPGARPVSAPAQRPPIEEQLRTAQYHLDHRFAIQQRRRAEDRIRDALHDARATTVRSRVGRV